MNDSKSLSVCSRSSDVVLLHDTLLRVIEVTTGDFKPSYVLASYSIDGG